MSTYSTDDLENAAPTPAERKALALLLQCWRTVREKSGWGRVTVTFENGEVVLMETAYTVKPARKDSDQ